jgi:hypothetical protein
MLPMIIVTVLLASSIKTRLRLKLVKIKEQLFWNTPIRFVIQQWQPLAQATVINLCSLNFDVSETLRYNSNLSVVFFGGFIGILGSFAVILNKNRGRFSDSNFQK